MAISPMDIHHKEFGTVRVGGYNKEEVDSFLDMVADELDRLLHRSQEQAELVESMRQKATQFDSMQQTLQNALINAQKSADSIVQEARLQAEEIQKEAKEQSARILEEAQSERSRISRYYSGIREQVLNYVATINELMDKNRSLIKEYEARLTEAELKEQPAPPSPPPTSEPERAVLSEPPAGLRHTAPGEGAQTPAPEPHPAPPPVREPVESPAREEMAPPIAPAFDAPREPMPAEQLDESLTTGPEGTGRPARYEEAQAPPPHAAISPEEEMEMMRDSLQQKEPEPAPQPEPVHEPFPEQAPGAPEEGEKHFFWE